MYFQPSRQGGFARNDAESAYPELWAGLTGAWVPGLGAAGVSMRHANNTGTSVEDLSGFGGNMSGDGTTSNRVTIVGGPAYEFVATSGAYLSLTAGRNARDMFRTTGVTVVVHKQKTDGTNRDACIFGNPGLVAVDRLLLYAPAASGNVAFDFGGNSGSNRLLVSGLTCGDDIWVCRAGTQGMYLWQNGILVASSSTPVTFGNTSSEFRWGGGVGSTTDLCKSKVLLTFDRELSDRDVMLLSMNPYAPFVVKHPVKLIQAPGGTDLEHEVEQSLNLGQSASCNFTRERAISDTMSLISDGSGGTVDEVFEDLGIIDDVQAVLFVGDIHNIVDELGLTDEVTGGNSDVQTVEDELGLTDSVSVIGPIYVEVHDYFNVTDNAVGILGMPWLPLEVEDVLGLTDRAARGWYATASSTMNLVSTAWISYVVYQAINWSQTAAVGKSKLIPDEELDLEQSVILNADWRRSCEHTGILQDAVTYWMDSPCARKRYTPFEGEGGTMPDVGLQTRSSHFTLETVTGPYSMVVLRNPEIDDRDRLGFNRVNRETRGGELEIYSDPVWAKVNTLLFTFVALKPTIIEGVQDFLLATLGQEIKITDWRGIVWKGVITTPGESATEDQDGWWTFTFEFEGEPYEGQAPAGRVEFSQEVTVELLPGVL